MVNTLFNGLARTNRNATGGDVVFPCTSAPVDHR